MLVSLEWYWKLKDQKYSWFWHFRNVNIVKIEFLERWICEKWDFKNVNFVKIDISKMWILWKLRFLRGGFCKKSGLTYFSYFTGLSKKETFDDWVTSAEASQGVLENPSWMLVFTQVFVFPSKDCSWKPIKSLGFTGKMASEDATKRLSSKKQTLDDAYAAPANFLEIDVINPITHGIGNKRYTDYEVRMKVNRLNYQLRSFCK